MRRKSLTVAVLVVVLTSGCVGFLLGDTLAFSASKATVSDAALSDAGYEQKRVDKVVENRTFEAGGQSRKVKVTNWVAEYEKGLSVEGAGQKTVASFATLSSPRFEIAGKSVNPLARYSDRKLVEKFVQRYEGVSDVRKVGGRNATMLSKETSVSKFEATATVAGREVDVTIHVAKVEHGDDVVVAMGVYPSLVDMEDDVFRLIEGVQHGS